MQGSSDAINNKGTDSAKLPKDQVFLKIWQPYHATLESWIGKKSTHQLISYRHVKAQPVIALRGFCDMETAQKNAHTVCQADQIGKH
jgi:hypothetical protein